MKLEFQPLVLSQVTQSLSLEGSGLVHCFSGSAFIGPEEEITQREGAPDPLMPCSVVWRGNLRCVGMRVMTGEDAGLACVMGRAENIGGGVSGASALMVLGVKALTSLSNCFVPGTVLSTSHQFPSSQSSEVRTFCPMSPRRIRH